MKVLILNCRGRNDDAFKYFCFRPHYCTVDSICILGRVLGKKPWKTLDDGNRFSKDSNMHLFSLLQFVHIHLSKLNISVTNRIKAIKKWLEVELILFFSFRLGFLCQTCQTLFKIWTWQDTSEMHVYLMTTLVYLTRHF